MSGGTAGEGRKLRFKALGSEWEERERRESLQTMSHPLHCTIEGQGGTLREDCKVTVFIFFNLLNIFFAIP